VNLFHHANAFATLDQAFDPASNTDYAARFLVELFKRSGSWPQAAALYHSATPELGAEYERKVMAIWPEETHTAAVSDTKRPLAAAWAATLDGAGYQPPFRSGAAHFVPLVVARGPSGMTGRDLSSYRAAPILTAFRRF
ncbi:MAG: lytic transglycosylase domain-containing protein, partial [Acetobacteraceae bacterium]|nr:lytic transglycosylase domain-containing protein [Acetobacteraceae bacterium]